MFRKPDRVKDHGWFREEDCLGIGGKKLGNEHRKSGRRKRDRVDTEGEKSHGSHGFSDFMLLRHRSHA